VRVSAAAVEDDRIEARQSMLDAYPSLQARYKADDGNTQVFYLKEAKAVFYGFNGKQKTVEF
jgi:uncharacterized pyridoxamine 5'-phosphate oxidase family protein